MFSVRKFLPLLLLISSPALASLQLLDNQIYDSEFDYLNSRRENQLLETNIGQFTQDHLRDLIKNSSLTPEDREYLLKTTRNTFENQHAVVNLKWNNFFAVNNSDDLHQLEMIAHTNPFFIRENNVYIPNDYAGMAGQLYLEAFRWLSFDIKPYFLFHDDPALDTFYLKEVYASLHINKLSIDVGKMRLRWGYGAYQPMAFSDDMEPFFMVRMRNNEDIDFLGMKTKFELFYGWLDQFRTYPHGNIIGSTFSFQPTDRFQFHFTQTVLYGGEGAPSNSPFLFYTETFVDSGINPANRNSSVGLRYRIPGIEIEPYLDVYIEDCCRNTIVNSRDMLNLVGLYLPPKDSNKKFDMAVEWVRTNHITYRHEAYPYTQSQKILGHPIGPDATGIYAVARYFHSKQLQFETLLAYENRGREGRALSNRTYKDIRTVEPGFEDAEQRHRAEEYIHFLATPAWKWTVHLGLERINHLNYVLRDDKWQGIFGLESSYNF